MVGIANVWPAVKWQSCVAEAAGWGKGHGAGGEKALVSYGGFT